MEKPVKFNELPIYEVNPFLPGLVSKFFAQKHSPNKIIDVADIDSGEIMPAKVVSKELGFFWADRVPFIKMFNDLDNYQDNANLGKAANSLFWLICARIRPKMDTLRLTNAEYMDYAKAASRTQFYQAVSELAAKYYIAKQGKEVYFINPHRFFNGDRTILINESAKEYWIKRNK